MKHGRSFSLLQKIGRMIKYRLLIPLIRSPHPPEYKARGVAVGMAWAMTPLVGIQMWLVFMTWAFLRKVFKWHFSLPLALAYTWVSNVFTLVPIYYGFYVTGQIMRGNGAHIRGYQNLKHIIESTFLADYDFYQKWALFFKLLLKDWGVSMAIGCIPWAIVFGIGSYYVTMKYARMRDKLRQMRLERTLRREQAARADEQAARADEPKGRKNNQAARADEQDEQATRADDPKEQAVYQKEQAARADEQDEQAVYQNEQATRADDPKGCKNNQAAQGGKRAMRENEKTTARVSKNKKSKMGDQARSKTKSARGISSQGKKERTAKYGTGG